MLDGVRSIQFSWTFFYRSSLSLLIRRRRYRKSVQPAGTRCLSKAPEARSLPVFGAEPQLPGVTILRPLKGLEADLYLNLESTFLQDYPDYEIIFSVASDDDPTIAVVKELISKYAGKVQAKLIIGEEVVGVNPKVNNLVRSYRLAQNDILWLLDSNIAVQTGTLSLTIEAFVSQSATDANKKNNDPWASGGQVSVGLVHHFPLALGSHWNCDDEGTKMTMGSQVEQVYLNTYLAKMYLAINALTGALPLDGGSCCVLGKSNLFRRSDVDRLDGKFRERVIPTASEFTQAEVVHRSRGLVAFGRFLAEDTMLARALWHELGLRPYLSEGVVCNVVGGMSLNDYVQRRVRWIRLRQHFALPPAATVARKVEGAAVILEPFTESVALAAIMSASVSFLFAPEGKFLLFFLVVIHFVAWFGVDMDVFTSLVRGLTGDSEKIHFPRDHSNYCWNYKNHDDKLGGRKEQYRFPVRRSSHSQMAQPKMTLKGPTLVWSWVTRELLALPIYFMALCGNEVVWRGNRYRLLSDGEAVELSSKSGSRPRRMKRPVEDEYEAKSDS